LSLFNQVIAIGEDGGDILFTINERKGSKKTISVNCFYHLILGSK